MLEEKDSNIGKKLDFLWSLTGDVSFVFLYTDVFKEYSSWRISCFVEMKNCEKMLSAPVKSCLILQTHCLYIEKYV